MNDQFKNSRRFSIALYVIVTALCVYAVEKMGAAAAPILTTSLPMLLAHAMAYSHITNKNGTAVTEGDKK
jgi:hypothetical protein